MPGSVVVIIGDNGKILVHDTPQPDATWRTYRVPLTATAFRLNNAVGPVVSESQFLAAMSDLEALRISAEFGAVVEETTYLDSVCWRSAGCDADVNCDNVVNANDLLAFINGWGGGPHHAADATADGTVNANDLLLVINSWGQCP